MQCPPYHYHQAYYSGGFPAANVQPPTPPDNRQWTYHPNYTVNMPQGNCAPMSPMLTYAQLYPQPLQYYQQEQHLQDLQHHQHYHPQTHQVPQQVSTDEGALVSPNANSRAHFRWMNGRRATNEKTRTRDKYRSVYSEAQRLELERQFWINNRFISPKQKIILADELDLTERQIKIWFQNRRAKERRQMRRKQEEEDLARRRLEERNLMPPPVTCSNHRRLPEEQDPFMLPSCAHNSQGTVGMQLPAVDLVQTMLDS